jgi:hypothetical protein
MQTNRSSERLRAVGALFGLTFLVVLHPRVSLAELGGVTIIGPGLSCGVWAERRARQTAVTHQQWIIGYLSGLASQSRSNFLQGIDDLSIYLWIDKFCRESPLSEIHFGASQLARELHAKVR